MDRHFKKTDYAKLDGRQKEVYNFHCVAALLAKCRPRLWVCADSIEPNTIYCRTFVKWRAPELASSQSDPELSGPRFCGGVAVFYFEDHAAARRQKRIAFACAAILGRAVEIARFVRDHAGLGIAAVASAGEAVKHRLGAVGRELEDRAEIARTAVLRRAVEIFASSSAVSAAA